VAPVRQEGAPWRNGGQEDAGAGQVEKDEEERQVRGFVWGMCHALERPYSTRAGMRAPRPSLAFQSGTSPARASIAAVDANARRSRRAAAST
jgi:hypothetical protein